MGVLALLVASPALLAGQWAFALVGDDSAGLDHEVAAPGPWPQVLGWVLLTLPLTVAVLTGRWARKKWLGYLLLGLTLSAVLGVTGLVLMGFL